MLNASAANARAAMGAAMMCFGLAAVAGALPWLPKSAQDHSPPMNPLAWSGVAGALAVVGVVLFVTAKRFRLRATAFMAAELARRGAAYYDVGTSTMVANAQVAGRVVLGRDAVFVIMPPMNDLGGRARQRWKGLVGRTVEYRAIPPAVTGHADWPVVDADPAARVLVALRADVQPATPVPHRPVLALPTTAGKITLVFTRDVRDLIRQRFTELGWAIEG